jgi:acylphosphatase
MLKHLNITITGKVQRIGFRFQALQMAYEYGIKGNVKNLNHNKVYIEAEGDEESLDKYLKWAKKGPPGSVVKDFLVEEGEMKNYNAFDIIH